MFEKLRSALGSLAGAVTQRRLSEKELEEVLWNFELALLESDVAQEVVAAVKEQVKRGLVGHEVRRGSDSRDVVVGVLVEAIAGLLQRDDQPDLLERIRAKRARGEPYVIVFLGINGTGKTTSIAKFAYLLKQQGLSVVMACADTHRAGAIEQLEEHARRLSVKTITQQYGADPAAVGRDAVLYARSHRVDVVLIDTAGRIQTSRNLMEEMAKIVRVTQPDFKIFVGDALAGNDAISQAKQFHSFTSFDGAILTKAEADAKGGAALSIAYITGKPILYLGVGQRYEDLVSFNTGKFVASLVGQ